MTNIYFNRRREAFDYLIDNKYEMVSVNLNTGVAVWTKNGTNVNLRPVNRHLYVIEEA